MTAYSNLSAMPKKHYGLILADPPWRFKTYAPPKLDQGSRAAERHYPTMSIEDIMAMDIRSIAGRNCYLMLWCSWPFLLQGLAVMKAWGFTYSSDFKVWMKLKESFSPTRTFISTEATYSDLHWGPGYTTRKNTEFILLGRRGSPKRLVRNEHEVMISPVREHSRKPDETIAACERYASGPYLELFARTERPNWDAYGDQVEKFVTPAPPPLPMLAAPGVQEDIFEEDPEIPAFLRSLVT